MNKDVDWLVEAKDWFDGACLTDVEIISHKKKGGFPLFLGKGTGNAAKKRDSRPHKKHTPSDTIRFVALTGKNTTRQLVEISSMERKRIGRAGRLPPRLRRTS